MFSKNQQLQKPKLNETSQGDKKTQASDKPMDEMVGFLDFYQDKNQKYLKKMKNKIKVREKVEKVVKQEVKIENEFCNYMDFLSENFPNNAKNNSEEAVKLNQQKKIKANEGKDFPDTEITKKDEFQNFDLFLSQKSCSKDTNLLNLDLFLSLDNDNDIYK